jgi:glucuronoarabinoxylan endo-1,4-beta-xylanase
MGQPAISAFFNNGGHLWASEVDASETTYNSAMTGTDGGLVLAQAIHSYLTAQNVSGFEWWELAYYSDITPPNAGYTDSNFNPSSRYYVVGNWSKFVRPGWVRIDATVNPVSGVYVTAFKAPDNSAYAIVAVNENGSSVDLAVSLDGFPSVASVTPTVTSESFNLTDQADVSVSGTAFSYSLPATSVVTFHGAPSSSSSSSSNKSPAPPTALALIVK